MEVIHIDACPYDLNKLFKCVAAFGTSSFVRGQIARNDVWKWTWSREWTKIASSAQIGCRIDFSRLAKVWVSAWRKLGRRACAVATITVRLRVNDVAA